MRNWLHTVPRIWIITTVIGLAVAAAAAITLTVTLTTRETCDDWSAELIEAMEDGTLLDGTFEASEACKEQMRRDLDQLSR